MRKSIVAPIFAAASVIATASIAAEPVPGNLLAGTRWMEIGVFDTIENIAPEKMLLLRICAIADIAFVMQDGRLTKYDRAGLSGKGPGPIGFVSIDEEGGADGATLVTLHTAEGAEDAPARYLVDVGGEIMRIRIGSANGSAYMKCRMVQR